MCGIVGVVRHDGQAVSPRTVARMAAAIRHRGPDDSGLLIEPGIALAHQRLAILDLSTGHQPMTAGACTVVFNGEIYNYIELRDELRAAGVVFQTSSDTEVLLQAYRHFGPACVSKFNGIFAFLIFDRARRVVFAARDHLGVKPLYYLNAGNELLFASEIKAFWQHPLADPEVNPTALQEYITLQFVTGPDTLFRHVNKLPPAHCMEVCLATGRQRLWRYWEPHFGAEMAGTESEVVERVRALLDDAVRLQLRSDVAVGSYLSGGLDSSIVTALAAQRTSLVSFTGRFPDGPAFDESAYAREVAAHLRIPLHEVVPTEDEFVDLLPRLVYHMDEPAAGPGLFPQFVTSRLARQHVKVVLGGQGGDEVFGGYVRYLLAYFEQALKGAIFETNEESQHIVSLGSMVRSLPALREYRPMMQRFWQQGLFESMDRRYFRLLDRSEGMHGLLDADLRHALNPEHTFERFAAVFNRPDTPSYYNKMTAFDLAASLPALLHVEDRVSMAHGLESRVPLLDVRLVEFVTSLPARRKFARGELKRLLKRAGGAAIPASIVARKDKMGFPVPLHRWVQGRSREFVHDTLLAQRARQRGLFDPHAVEQLLASEPPFSRRVWGLLNLELWHATFVDHPAPALAS